MHYYIELWTPKKAWLDLSTEEREAFVGRVAPVMEKHEEMGIEMLAMGSLDPDTDQGVDHAFYSVFRMPDIALAKTFEKDVREVGWYDYFRQTNARGKARTAEEVIGEHISM